MSKEFIKTIELNSSEQFQFDETIRAIILIVEDFSPEDSFCKWLGNFEVPVILTLKVSTNEKLAAASHLCIAAQNSRIGKLSAEETLKLGLINKVVSFEDVEKEAFELAEKIVRLAPLAIRGCLKAVNKGLEMTLENGLELESNLFAQMFSTSDMREGTSAFLEKRKAVFRGK